MIELAEALLDRTLAWVTKHKAGLRRAGLVVALLVFAAGLWLSLQAVPDLASRIDWPPFLLLIAVASPAQALLNAAEFRLMARYGGHRIEWRAALEVSIYGTAANMLPLPGGVVTRLAAMRVYGSSVLKGSALIALFVGTWGGMAFLIAGVAISVQGLHAFGIAMTAVGAVILLRCTIGCLRFDPSLALLSYTLLIRFGSLTLEAVRMMICLYALGIVIGLDQASIFVVSSFLGAITAVIPAGLGVREAVVAALAPLIGVPAAIGFLSAAIGRVASMAGIGLITAAVAMLSPKNRVA